MECIDTKIRKLKLIKPKIHRDSEDFLETYKKSFFKDAGIHYDFVQDNHSRSKKNTLRGFIIN